MSIVALKVKPMKTEYSYERVFFLNNAKTGSEKRADQYASFMIKRPKEAIFRN